jgi:AGCS family alanine or glycine:cation symporter
MFQANQTVAILTNSFEFTYNLDLLIALLLTVSVGIVLIGGIRRIAVVAEGIVPLMALIYIAASITILVTNASAIPEAFSFMFTQAFSPEALGGGIMGALINGFRRAVFSNEAGLGSAPIAHSAARTKEPVREGCVALLEPFIDTMVICMMTGLVITVTGAYLQTADSGVLLTSYAFATVSPWFPKVLAIAVVLFAYSTMITWSYYGERAWSTLFGHRSIGIYHIIFLSALFIGGVVDDLVLITNLSDLLLLSMAIPNMIGVYLLSNVIAKDVKEYRRKLKAGEFKVVNS